MPWSASRRQASCWQRNKRLTRSRVSLRRFTCFRSGALPADANRSPADFIKDLRDEKVPIQADAVEEAPPVYSATHAPPPPSPEDAAKLRAEKRAALEARHTTYEQEIARLGQAEYLLLVDRLVQLREQAQKDMTVRFEAALESLDDEGDLMVGRLGKYFARVGANLREDEVETKAREADELAAKAQARVARKAQAIKDEVAKYRTTLEAKEKAAVAEARAAVTDLVDKAQSELGQGWTWLDGVTAKDWQREFAWLARSVCVWSPPLAKLTLLP